MRIWNIPVQNLCRQHLLGEHRELHCIWTFLTADKGGSYKKHPETLRWADYLDGLFVRHCQQVIEMSARGYKHNSLIKATPLAARGYYDDIDFPPPITALADQIANIKAKGECGCKLDGLL